MKGTLIKSICFALFWCGIAQLATAQGIVVNKLDGTKVYFKASDVVSVGVYGYGEGPDDTSDIHEYVDLGLPSGTLWATMNVGAEKPEDYGDYFAWGETKGYNGGKNTFNWNSYKYYDTSFKTMTKYCTKSNYGSIDNKIELEMEDDAATVNWGVNWQMPSEEQFAELVNENYVTTTWTKLNDIDGYLIVSKNNGNRIFLPGACYYDGTSFPENINIHSGNYWSRSLYSYTPEESHILRFNSINYTRMRMLRYKGLSVRPVRAQR